MNKVENYESAKLSEEQEKYISEFEATKKEIAEHIEKFELHLAGEKAYHYFWHTFADIIIEVRCRGVQPASGAVGPAVAAESAARRALLSPMERQFVQAVSRRLGGHRDHLGGGVELHGAGAQGNHGVVQGQIFRFETVDVAQHLGLGVVLVEYLVGQHGVGAQQILRNGVMSLGGWSRASRMGRP